MFGGAVGGKTHGAGESGEVEGASSRALYSVSRVVKLVGASRIAPEPRRKMRSLQLSLARVGELILCGRAGGSPLRASGGATWIVGGDDAAAQGLFFFLFCTPWRAVDLRSHLPCKPAARVCQPRCNRYSAP